MRPTYLAAVAALFTGPAQAETVIRRVAAMGTSATVEVAAPTRAEALAAGEAAVRALEATESRTSTWRDDSELSLALRRDDERHVRLSPELAEDLRAALGCAARTGGAFDPTVGPLVAAWDLRSGGRVPSRGELESARAQVDHRRVRLTRRRFGPHDASLVIEEGAFAKGAALDEALAAARAAGARQMRLDLGGQVTLLGDALVAVADPRLRDRPVVRLALSGGSLATTGNGERGFMIDGVRYGHVLDPRTGHPAPDRGSVSVWSPRGLDADCLSTALYVMGPDQALRFAEAATDVEVLLLDPVSRTVRASTGLRGRIRQVAEGWHLKEGDR